MADVLGKVIVAVALLASMTGCGGSDGDATTVRAQTFAEGRSNPPAAAVSPATPAAKEAISDWYEDGVFDRDHSCTAIETAIRALPGTLARYEFVVAALRDHRAAVC